MNTAEGLALALTKSAASTAVDMVVDDTRDWIDEAWDDDWAAISARFPDILSEVQARAMWDTERELRFKLHETLAEPDGVERITALVLEAQAFCLCNVTQPLEHVQCVRAKGSPIDGYAREKMELFGKWPYWAKWFLAQDNQRRVRYAGWLVKYARRCVGSWRGE